MFRSMKSKAATLIVAGSIISGVTLASPAFAKHHADTTPSDSSQKLALATDNVATQQTNVASGDSAVNVKTRKSVKPSQSNYFDVEKYNFDMGGTSALTGI